jgi:hypothetical protein
MREEWLVRTRGFITDFDTGAWQRKWKGGFGRIPGHYQEGHTVLTMRVTCYEEGGLWLVRRNNLLMKL